MRDSHRPFCQRLSRALEYAGLNPNQLAGRLGTPASTVAKWLEDNDPPTLPAGKFLVRLPGVLGVDGHWLLTGEGSLEVVPESDAQRKLRLIRGIVEERAGGKLEEEPEEPAAPRPKPGSRGGKQSA